ncbi:MAG: hypothetical protein PHU85_02280 [Phycisphaerae bacterium]|nr:hypothetical protein [Phycisphaerae bacterium]
MAIGSELDSKLTLTGASSYDLGDVYPSVPLKMFLNNRYPTCVIATRASQTMVLELVERGVLTVPTDAEVLREHYRETGGRNVGLGLSTSLGKWQKTGWSVGGKTLKIRAKSAVAKSNHAKIMACIRSSLNLGVEAVMKLPLSASTQFRLYQTWSVTTGTRARAGSWGAHCVYVCGYTAAGLICRTWQREQFMTWGFWDKYAYQVYAVWDATTT